MSRRVWLIILNTYLNKKRFPKRYEQTSLKHIQIGIGGIDYVLARHITLLLRDHKGLY